MVLAAGQFERVADALTDRAAEVFARVAVVDARNVVVAGSRPEALGRPYAAGVAGEEWHVPLRLGAEAGEVIVAEPVNGEMISPLLGRRLVELMVNQCLMLTRLPN